MRIQQNQILAFKPEYREKVDELMTRLTELLKREYESGEIEEDRSLDGLGPQVQLMQSKLRRVFLIVMVLLLSISSILCYGCCVRCVCNKSNNKIKTKIQS